MSPCLGPKRGCSSWAIATFWRQRVACGAQFWKSWTKPIPLLRGSPSLVSGTHTLNNWYRNPENFLPLLQMGGVYCHVMHVWNVVMFVPTSAIPTTRTTFLSAACNPVRNFAVGATHATRHALSSAVCVVSRYAMWNFRAAIQHPLFSVTKWTRWKRLSVTSPSRNPFLRASTMWSSPVVQIQQMSCAISLARAK